MDAASIILVVLSAIGGVVLAVVGFVLNKRRTLEPTEPMRKPPAKVDLAPVAEAGLEAAEERHVGVVEKIDAAASSDTPATDAANVLSMLLPPSSESDDT